MPSIYRSGIDNDGRLRRIDIGGPPSKKQRTDNDADSPHPLASTTTIFEELSSNSSHSCSDCTSVIKNNNSNDNEDAVVDDDEERMGGMIVSSSSLSLSISEAMMVVEVDEYNDETTVKSILTNYLQNIDEIYTNEEERTVVLKEGLDKLYHLVGEKNTNYIIKQQHRVEMLELGGHWLLTDLLRTFLAGNNNGNGNETNVVDVVSRACEILHELLLTDPNAATTTSTATSTASTTSKVKYQVYCAGGLDMILSALNKFPSNYHVQLTGCKFISCLISCSSSSSSSSSFDNNNFEDDLMNHDDNENTPHAHYGGNNLTGVIDDLYRSTDGLDVIVRLVGGYNFVDDGTAANMPSSMNNISNNINNNGSLRTVQIWGLFFNATSVIQKVLQQSDPNSNRRSEIIMKVKEYSYATHYRSNNNNNEGDDNEMIDDDIDINNNGGEHVEDFHSSWGYGSGKGLAKHMYDHIMSILIDEDDYNDADANRGEQYMRL
jgi:hypothetical protein